jgi:hypothetical protein
MSLLGRPVATTGAVAGNAGSLVAHEAVAEVKATGRVSPTRLVKSVASTEGAESMAIGVAQSAALSFVPGGPLVKAAAGLGLGAAVTTARGQQFSTGRAVSATAGSLICGTLLAPLPGGAIIGGVVGGIAGEEIYAAVRS